MNFYELMQKMRDIDQPVQETDKGDMDHDGKNEPDDQEYLDNKDSAIKQAMGSVDEADMPPTDSTASPMGSEDEVDECGMPGMENMPSGMMGMRAPPQSDSINANMSLNASGPGGIKNLMDILRKIDDGGSVQGDGEMMPPDQQGGDDREVMIKKLPGFDAMMNAETFANEPDEMYGNMDSSIRDGGDLNRSKRSFARAQPGDNPMAVESIKNKLSSLYEEIKSR